MTTNSISCKYTVSQKSWFQILVITLPNLKLMPGSQSHVRLTCNFSQRWCVLFRNTWWMLTDFFHVSTLPWQEPEQANVNNTLLMKVSEIMSILLHYCLCSFSNKTTEKSNKCHDVMPYSLMFQHEQTILASTEISQLITRCYWLKLLHWNNWNWTLKSEKQQQTIHKIFSDVSTAVVETSLKI